MIGEKTINEIKKYKPLKDILTNGKNVGRHVLDTYFSEIPYTKKRKEWELKFFLEDIEFINKKWIIEIIWELETYKGSNFNELKRSIKGISSRALSIRLKELEKQGIISRTVQDSRPPKVFYQLSEKGKCFVELMILVILFLKGF
ncbi:MAG: transcriptional regulator [Promethearchaeota archaeon]|nr:MAG: transcriptional regulator [Candidatus Lokiarchaeota archaeon]